MTFLQAPELIVVPKRIVHDFANDPAGPIPSTWTNRFIQGDAANLPEVMSGGYIRSGRTSTWNSNSRWVTTKNEKVNTDDQIVRGQISTTINGLYSGMCLKMDDTMMNGAIGVLSTGADRGIWSVINGVGSKIAGTTFTTTYVLGETWAFRVSGNIYSIIRNPNFDNTGGTVIWSWTDTSQIIKTGPDYRRGGYLLSSDHNALGTQSWSSGWANFDFRDLSWTA